MQTRSVMTREQSDALIAYLAALPMPFTVNVREGKVRSLSQNALLHKWFGEIAAQTHSSADQVKRECKFYQGCPILMADDPRFV